MVIIFVTSLVAFSTFIYYQTKNMEHSYNILSDQIHEMDLLRYAHGFNFLNSQYNLLERIYQMDTVSSSDRLTKMANSKLHGVAEFRKRLVAIQSKRSESLTDSLEHVWNDFESLGQEVFLAIGKQYDSDSLKAIAKQEAYTLFNREIGKITQRFYPILFKGIGQETTKAKENTYEQLEFYTSLAIRFIVIASIVICFVVVSIWLRMRRSFRQSIERPNNMLKKLSQGELPEHESFLRNELDTVIDAANQLSDSLREACRFAQSVGKSDFTYDFTPSSEQDQLGNALLQMRNEIKVLTEREAQRHWISQGRSQAADLLRVTHQSGDQAADQILSFIISYVKANQGGLFVYESELNVLSMLSCYAYDRKKYVEKEITVGEGLVGQCYLEREPIYLTEIPAEYISITSGLGKTTPRSLFVVPLLVDDQVEGVLELASFRDFTESERLLITSIADAIGSFLATNRNQQRTKSLIEELQAKSGALSSQEEELRQNLEEMQATQEEMRRRENSYKQQIEDLREKISH